MEGSKIKEICNGKTFNSNTPNLPVIWCIKRVLAAVEKLSFSTFIFYFSIQPVHGQFSTLFFFICFLFLAACNACNSTLESKVGLWRNKFGIFFKQMVEFTYGKVSTRTLPAKIMTIMSFGNERASVKIKWCWCGERRTDFIDFSI